MIRSFPPYDRYQREAFSYTIVASLLLCFGIRGSKASTSRSFLAKLQTKRLGCSLHWFYLTLLKIKDRGRAGSEGSFSRQHGFDEQQAPTPNKKNEKQQAERSLKKRAPFRESHCALAPCMGFQTCAPLNYNKLWSPYLFMGYFKKPLSTKQTFL